MLLITMGFLIVVLIYINMQRKCWNGKVYTKSTSTQNPGARKPAHAGTGASQNSKSRSATADRLNSLSLDFFNGIAYNKSVETQDGCHYTYVTQDTRSVASASVSRLFGADGSLLLIIPKSIPYLNDNPGNRYDPEQILKTDMYHLPRNRFPAGATIHAILSAHTGGQATVLLTVIRWVST